MVNGIRRYVRQIYSMGTTAIKLTWKKKKKKWENVFFWRCTSQSLKRVIFGRGTAKKFSLRWRTNLKRPEEFEYGLNHCIFKDPSAPSKKKVQTISDQCLIASLPANGWWCSDNVEGELDLMDTVSIRFHWSTGSFL